MTRRIAGVGVGAFLCAWWALHAAAGPRDGEWWPERAAFQSSGGQYRETPAPDGRYIYDAENAVIYRDGKLTPGAQAARDLDAGLKLLPVPFLHDGLVAWDLGAIKPGRYWLGLQVRSGDEGDPQRGLEFANSYLVRVNGRLLNFSRFQPPVCVGSNTFAAEMQAAGPVDLQPGDRVTVSAYTIRDALAGKLLLYPAPPSPGPIVRQTAYIPERTGGPATELWFARLDFTAAPQSGLTAPAYTHNTFGLRHEDPSAPAAAPVKVRYRLQNRARGAQALAVNLGVTDYYGRRVATKAAQHELADGAQTNGTFEFVTGESPRYVVRMETRGRDGLTEVKNAYLIADVTAGEHRRYSLDGAWEKLRLPGLIKIGNAPPADARWESYSVPGAIPMGAVVLPPSELAHRHTHVAWARRSFTVPDWLKGSRYVLRFDRLCEEAVVYVNGQEVGRHFGLLDPCEFDVTAVLRPGANEVLVGLRDWISRLDQKALEANGPEWKIDPQGALVAPSGLIGGNWRPGCGVLGHVELKTRPTVAVTDFFAKSSVRRKELGLELTVHNAGSNPRRVIVAPVVKDAGTAVLRMPEETCTIKGGESTVVNIAAPFPQPRLWTVYDPHLYETAITVTDAETQQALDEYRGRFGFREFYSENGLYRMNGDVAKIGARENDEPGDETGAFHRRTPSVDQMDEADETGLLFKFQGTPGIGSPTEYVLANDLYWKNATDFGVRIVRALRNHPSIVIWEPSNEFVCFTRHLVNGTETASQRLCEVGKAIQAVDPTRPIEFDGDWDLNGRWNTISLHYPNDFRPLERSQNLYVPDGLLWRPMERPLQRGDPYQLESNGARIPAKHLDKPVVCSEIGQYSIGVAHDLSIIGGDEPYRSFAAGIMLWEPLYDRYILDGARDIEATEYTPWHHFDGLYALIMPPRYVVALDYMGHWRSKETVRFRANLHHDILRPETMTVRWALYPAPAERRGTDEVNAACTFPGRVDERTYGRPLLEGVLADRVFQPGEMERAQVAFRAPAVKTETRCRFVLEVLREGKAAFRREHAAVVYGARAETVRMASRVGLYDPLGKSAPALQALGLKARTLARVDEDGLGQLDVLLIGRDAVSQEAAPAIAGPVQRLVERGGRVVVFEHGKPVRWLPYLLTADPGHTASFAFPRVPDHPALQGIALDDLRLWRPDRVVSRHDYLKPNRGRFLSLVDTGGTLGLEWTPLLELYVGKGSYVLCQLCLTEKAASDPCAAKLLANVLRYVDGAPYLRPRPVAVLADAASPLALMVERLTTDAVALPPAGSGDLKDASGLLVDASVPMTDPRAAEIVGVAKRGGHVVLHGLSEKTAPIWAKALGVRLELRAVAPYCLGWAIRRDWDPLLAGLSMHDLHWQERAGGDQDSFQERMRIEELARTELVTDAPGAVRCTYPAVFVRIPCGAGGVLLDQTRWDTAGEAVGPRARRIASTLLTQLGAEFKAVPSVRTVEKPLAYVPIDLSAFANRPVADAVADDGEGGWSDQGPRNDGREFPRGRVLVKGVPFLIGGEQDPGPEAKAVIVLNREQGRFKQVAEEVKGIPVGCKVETLNFLHTGAWMNGNAQFFSYVVNYADGTREELPIIGGINILDWWLDNMIRSGWTEFSGELPGVTTQIGLIAENPSFEATGAYLMEWVNPHPDRAVATVDILNRGYAVSIVLGITAGVKPGDAPPAGATAAGDRAQALALVQRADPLLKDGRYADAEKELAQATQADPECGRAWFLLGQAQRSQKKYPEAIRSLRVAMRLMPENTEALNELASLLEAQGKKVQALAVYRESLKANWNQPPVIDAIGRLK